MKIKKYLEKKSSLEGQKGGIRVLLLLLVLLGGAVYLYKDLWQLSVRVFDRGAPAITLLELPAGIGRDTVTFGITANDDRSGVHELVVRAHQNGQEKELFRKQYTASRLVSEEIELSGRELRFTEGEVEIEVLAFDQSMWSNSSEERFTLEVDYTPPLINVLTHQHNTSQAGASLVFYRIPNKEVLRSGVMAGDRFFSGFKARDLDAAFADDETLYFSLFPVPIDFDPDNERLTVYAEDRVGNSNSSGFNYQVRKTSFPSPAMTLSQRFLDRKLPELLPGFLRMNQEATPHSHHSSEPEDLIHDFRLVNEDFRYLLEEKLQRIFKDSVNKRLWSGPFSRMRGAQQMAGFGEHRHYSFEGKDAGRSFHMGVDLASIANSPVHAANEGRVVFADDLGIYGKTVIIDHGFSLHTLYGHLSSILVVEGDEVSRDSEIGKSGETGMAGGDHLHFEVRLHGVPVSPITWWDGNWIRDHVDNKIRQVAELSQN